MTVSKNSSQNRCAPGFLVASPKLDDSPFERAVILMVHHDAEGAMGFIVNKPLGLDFGSLMASVDEDLAKRIPPEPADLAVHFGGPVGVEQLWVIYHDTTRMAAASTFDTSQNPHFDQLGDQGVMAFDEHWYVVASSDSIEAFALGLREQPFRPVIGYTGWGPGQLEAELEDGSWLFLNFESDLVFETEHEGSWATALKRIGVEPTAFLMMGKVGQA